jgi:hypothetical protein
MKCDGWVKHVEVPGRAKLNPCQREAVWANCLREGLLGVETAGRGYSIEGGIDHVASSSDLLLRDFFWDFGIADGSLLDKVR